MKFPIYLFPGRWPVWFPVVFVLIGLANQCTTSGPPLPASSDATALPVALLIPTEGELATFGRFIRNGVTLAFDEWNSRAGPAGHHLELTVYNTDCSFDMARQAAQQAVDDGFKFMIGPMCSEAALAAALVAQAAGVLMISPTAAHPLVTVDPQAVTRPTVFRAGYGHILQGRAAAHFAYDRLDVSKAALMYQPGDDYTTSLSEAFARQFIGEGGQIVAEAAYISGQSDLPDLLQSIYDSGAELLYLPTDSSLANQVMQQLKALDLFKSSPLSTTGLRLLGSDRWQSDSLDLRLAAGSYFPIHYNPDEERVPVQRWKETFKSANAAEPDTLAALGYDAANMLAEAIHQAAAVDPVPVAQKLELGSFDGVTGQITFDQHHNPVKPVPFVKVQNKRIVFVTTIKPDD